MSERILPSCRLPSALEHRRIKEPNDWYVEEDSHPTEIVAEGQRKQKLFELELQLDQDLLTECRTEGSQ